MVRKGTQIALIVLFCAWIAVFGVLYLTLPRTDFSAQEKRVLANFPEVSLSTVFSGKFESGLETWMSDHIPGRDALVGINAYYELASGRNGLGGTILAGGRLYDAPDALDEVAVSRKCEILNRFYENTGLPMDVMIVPAAGYALEDTLPLHAPYADGALAAQVRDELNGGIRFLWPELLLDAETAPQLYYATDHHLTSRGSYEICRMYVESLGLSMPEISDYEIETHEDFRGSMYSQSGLWGVEPDTVEIWRSKNLGGVQVSFDDRESADALFFPEHLEDLDKYPTFLDGNHGLVTIETGNADAENLLLIRDSFGHCFAPFAADSFHRIVLVDLRYYRKSVQELAEEMEIDRVLVLYGSDTFLTDTNFTWLR